MGARLPLGAAGECEGGGGLRVRVRERPRERERRGEGERDGMADGRMGVGLSFCCVESSVAGVIPRLLSLIRLHEQWSVLRFGERVRQRDCERVCVKLKRLRTRESQRAWNGESCVNVVRKP